MKVAILLSLLGMLVVTVSAVASQKAVIISYPNETPDSVVNQAMDAIREAVSSGFTGRQPQHGIDRDCRVALLRMNTVSPLSSSMTSKPLLTVTCAELFKYVVSAKTCLISIYCQLTFAAEVSLLRHPRKSLKLFPSWGRIIRL